MMPRFTRAPFASLLLLAGAAVMVCGPGAANAAGPEFSLPELTLSPEGTAPLTIAPEAAMRPELREEETRGRWGQSDGHWWVTIGGGAAHDFKKDLDINAHVAFSTFIAKDIEFAVELGGWYFAQAGEDTGGVNPNMVFRWHFWHDKDYDWTVYGDAGIGLLFAFDEVPDGGTSFDFTPRLGVGFTKELDEAGTRLQLGLRYHHISNARIQGDERNPGRDSLMVYAGVIFPF